MEFLLEIDFKGIDYSPQKMKALLDQYKVVVLRNYDIDEEPQTFFNKFSDGLGHIIDMDEDLQTGAPTGNRWIDITYDPEIPDRYRSAPVAQPLHTDYSYIAPNDIVQFFYCVSQAEYGGATTFIDLDFLVKLLSISGNEELLNRLQSVPVTFEKGGRTKTRPILIKDEGEWNINWNYFCLSPNSSEDEKQLVQDFHKFLETRIVPSGLLTELLLHKNDVVFFSDYRVLHGRNAYFAIYKGQRSLNKGSILLESRVHKNPHLELKPNPSLS